MATKAQAPDAQVFYRRKFDGKLFEVKTEADDEVCFQAVDNPKETISYLPAAVSTAFDKEV